MPEIRSVRLCSPSNRPQSLLGCLVILACAALILVALWPSAGQAQEFPESMIGVWERSAAAPGQRTFLMLNDFGLMLVNDVTNFGLALTIAPFSGITLKENGALVEAKLLDPRHKTPSGQQIEQALGFELASGRLKVGDGHNFSIFIHSQNFPPVLRWSFGEGIAAFEALGTIKRACRQEDGPDCFKTAFRFVDVNGDGQLSAAEIARVLRALGFFVGYAIAPTTAPTAAGGNSGPVKPEDLAIYVAAAGVAGPFLAKSMLEGMDYDGNGALSVEELLQDRGDLASLTAAAAAMQPAMMQTTLGAALAVLPTLLKLLSPF